MYDRPLTRAELETLRLTTSAQVGVLANDTDADPGDGSFTYTPRRDFFGTDTFTYVASDGAAQTDPVTVTITVRERNFAPTAQPDTYTLDEDAGLSFDIPAGTVGEYRLGMVSEPGEILGRG